MFSKKNVIVCAAVAALSFGAVATSQAAQLELIYGDTRDNGSATLVQSPSTDSDGALQMKISGPIVSGQDKVGMEFLGESNGVIGTLGDLSSLSIDYYKASTPSTPIKNQFAYRLDLGGAALVWENNSNDNIDVPTDSWQHLNMIDGKFWQYGNGHNFNGAAQAYTLTDWVSGIQLHADGNNTAADSIVLDASTPIYGLDISYGSGLGEFTGYIDHPVIGFGGTSPVTYSANMSVPEPSSLGLIGLAGLALLARRSRRRIA